MHGMVHDAKNDTGNGCFGKGNKNFSKKANSKPLNPALKININVCLTGCDTNHKL